MKNNNSFFIRNLSKITLIIFIIVWEILIRFLDVSPLILPKPTNILYATYLNFQTLFSHTLTTTIETIIGLFFAIVFGIIIAIIFNEFKITKKIFYNFFVIFQTIPLIAIAPIFIIWFGLGLSSKIILITLICSFPIITSLTECFENINKDKYDYFQTFNTSMYKKYRYLYFYESIDTFFTATSIAISYSVISAIFAEYIGSKNGLGLYLNKAYSSFQIDIVFSIVLVIILLTFLLLFVNKKIYLKLKG